LNEAASFHLPTPIPSRPERFRREFGRRATGLAVALALELLLLLALLTLTQSADPPLEPRLTEVDLSAQEYSEPETERPEPEAEPAPESQPSPQPTQAPEPTLQPAPNPPARIPIPTAPPAPEPEETPRPPRPGVVMGPVQGPPNSGAPSAGDSERVGTAPNGEPLYAARWYREPGEEIRGYLSTASPGWGLIACRTVPNFYVTDCVPLGESPGSMLNRAMLAASGQFRVRPPRLGGQVLVGSWVRIRIDYTVRRE
jgi:protein TonB